MTKAFLFPGQGSQLVGMGFDFYNKYQKAKEIFQLANEISNFNLSELIFNGDQLELKKTKNSQVAIATTSIAILEVLRQENLFNINETENYTAGHSLGEYVALYYANVLSFEDAIKLLLLRGKIMDEVFLNDTGMASVLGIEADLIDEIIRNLNLSKKKLNLEIANFNSKTQTVISGDKVAINKFKDYILEKKIPAKIIILEVEKAFHSIMMINAKNKLQEALSSISLNQPKKNIIMNYDAKLLLNINNVKNNLLENVITGVKWKQTIQQMIQYNVTTFYSIGAGNALINMLKRDYPLINGISINNINDIA